MYITIVKNIHLQIDDSNNVTKNKARQYIFGKNHDQYGLWKDD